MDASQAPTLFAQGAKNTAAGILAFLAAEVLQLPEKSFDPVHWLNLSRRVSNEGKRAAYLLKKAGDQMLKQLGGGERHE